VETVKLSTRGQLVIPNEIRKAHHLAAGTEFVVSFVGDEVVQALKMLMGLPNFKPKSFEAVCFAMQ